jgi:hypothetical protein
MADDSTAFPKPKTACMNGIDAFTPKATPEKGDAGTGVAKWAGH